LYTSIYYAFIFFIKGCGMVWNQKNFQIFIFLRCCCCCCCRNEKGEGFSVDSCHRVCAVCSQAGCCCCCCRPLFDMDGPTHLTHTGTLANGCDLPFDPVEKAFSSSSSSSSSFPLFIFQPSKHSEKMRRRKPFLATQTYFFFFFPCLCVSWLESRPLWSAILLLLLLLYAQTKTCAAAAAAGTW
jgi:hypothetical protein